MTFELQATSALADEIGEFDCFLTCKGCAGGIVKRLASIGRDRRRRPESYSGNIPEADFVFGPTHPTIPSVEAPEHTPEPAAMAFREARIALQSGSFTLAAMGFRRTLEVALKLLDPSLTNMSLQARIDHLSEARRITPDLRNWAHAIRLDGNEAAHGIDAAASNDAHDLDGFCELFLQYVFTLPARITARRAP